MTILDHPFPMQRHTIHPAAHPAAERITPAPLGGGYVTTSSPRPATEGTYVTRTEASIHPGPVPPATRGTYVSASSAAPSGGTYTYTG